MRSAAVIIVVLVLLGAGGTAAAQSFSVGVHGGLSLARIASDTAVDTEFVPAPVVGVDAVIDLYAPLALSAGLEYLGEGGKVTTTMPGSPTFDYSLGTLAIPVNVRYGLGAGAAEAYVFAGATVGILLSANQKREDTGAEVDVKSAFSGVQVLIDLGGGIGYRVSERVSVSADVRYSLGVNDVAVENPIVAVAPWHVNALQIIGGVSYRFGAVQGLAPTPSYASR